MIGVTTKGDATHFREQILSIKRNAENIASQYVQNLSPEKRPAIDHLLWRQHEIAEAQALLLKQYFERERHRGRENLAILQKKITDLHEERRKPN